MTRYHGVDHYSTTLAEAAAWCRDNAIEDYADRDYDRVRTRGRGYCTCSSISESPCDYCSADPWCETCGEDEDECTCETEEDYDDAA